MKAKTFDRKFDAAEKIIDQLDLSKVRRIGTDPKRVTSSTPALASSLHLHVENVDSAFERAVQAGATVVRPLKDQFYGERSGTVLDPFGHEWLLGSHLEDVSTEEMQRRYTQLFEK